LERPLPWWIAIYDLGGAGINTGTISSKTLRETALALSGVRSRNLYGVDLVTARLAKGNPELHGGGWLAGNALRDSPRSIVSSFGA
jgi:hypothetical protein